MLATNRARPSVGRVHQLVDEVPSNFVITDAPDVGHPPRDAARRLRCDITELEGANFAQPVADLKDLIAKPNGFSNRNLPSLVRPRL